MKARGDNSVLDYVVEKLSEEASSSIKTYQKEEIDTFLKEKPENDGICRDRETQVRTAIDTYRSLLNELDDEALQVALKDFGAHMERIQKLTIVSRKRKMDKQEYFPSKKNKVYL